MEREKILPAALYERRVERTGYGYGFKDKAHPTRKDCPEGAAGAREDLEFYPSSL